MYSMNFNAIVLSRHNDNAYLSSCVDLKQSHVVCLRQTMDRMNEDRSIASTRLVLLRARGFQKKSAGSYDNVDRTFRSPVTQIFTRRGSRSGQVLPTQRRISIGHHI